MEIIGKEVIEKFKAKHPTSRAPLNDWIKKTEEADWKNYADMKSTFNSVDALGSELYCFNVKGNTIRLVAFVYFQDGQVFIDKVMTHAEYDKWNNRR
jgi:mRNA interferase HigB